MLGQEDFYFSLNISDVKRSEEDRLTDFCLEFGATGFSESLEFDQLDEEYRTNIKNPDLFSIKIYFNEEPSATLIKELQSAFQVGEISVTKNKTEDWQAEWKKGFQPFCLFQDFWIVPSWMEAPIEAKFPIYIDPGMAFGTGTHETTQIASELLVRTVGETVPSSMIDVGTGTGVLAIIGERLKINRIYATEIDKDAASTAKENIEKNKCMQIEISAQDLSSVKESFDLVLANIIDGVLVRLQSELVGCLNSGGTLILTGILCERESDFNLKFQAKNELDFVERIQKGEWVGYVYKKRKVK